MKIRPVAFLAILTAFFSDRTATAKKFDRNPEPPLNTLSPDERSRVSWSFIGNNSKENRRYQFEFCEPQDDDLRQWKKTLNLVLRELTKISLSKPAITNVGKCTRYNGEIEGSIRLNFSGASLVDLRPIAAIDYLFELNLSHNSIASLSPLEGMKLLFDLDVSFNKIEDLRPLKGLDNLNTLDASHNKITSLAPLGNTRLFRINLQNNQIADARPILNREKQRPDRVLLKGNHLNSVSQELALDSLFGPPIIWKKPTPGMVETFPKQEWDRLTISVEDRASPAKAYIWEKSSHVLHFVEAINNDAASKLEKAKIKYFLFRKNQQNWSARRWDVKGYVDKLNRIDKEVENILEPTDFLMCSGTRQRESYSVAKYDERKKEASFHRCKSASLQVGGLPSIDKVRELANQFAAIVRSGPPELFPVTISDLQPRCLFMGTPAESLFYKGEVFIQRCEGT